MRAQCMTSVWNEHGKDPELTKGKFYKVIEKNVITMGNESMVGLIGDSGEQIDRPKHIFRLLGK